MGEGFWPKPEGGSARFAPDGCLSFARGTALRPGLACGIAP